MHTLNGTHVYHSRLCLHVCVGPTSRAPCGFPLAFIETGGSSPHDGFSVMKQHDLMHSKSCVFSNETA